MAARQHLLKARDNSVDQANQRAEWAISKFAERFPQRSPLTADEVARQLYAHGLFRRIFQRYDIVHNYGIASIDAMLANKRPYVAFEHGTLRDIPFQDDAQGKLTALSYREADHVFITNCDNIRAARRLSLPHFSFVPHPVNEDGIESDERTAAIREQLERDHNADFILFHPARQHWTDERHPSWEKGNDFFFRGFADFVRSTAPRALCVCVEWGATLAQSKALLAKLGVADRVIWISPQPNRAMIRYVLASDVVADQFFLGAFGSLTPKAMMCGRPVLLHLDEGLHEWAFEEMPPVENVQSAPAITSALTRLYREDDYREERGKECRDWYWRHHSSARITADLVRVYRRVLSRDLAAAG